MPDRSKIGVLWAQYGPYHFARVAALAKLLAPARVHALELADRSRDYRWNRETAGVDLTTICPKAVTEQLPFAMVFRCARREFARLGIQICFLPSYSPKQSLAALLAARSLGIKTVMMNESHAGTASAGIAGTWVKRRLVGLFDAALVGGVPQQRYFTSLGLPAEKIFTGYDTVDNDYFAARTTEIRSLSSEFRAKYSLPEHYFLSLGRFVAKKNLDALIQAYRKYLDAGQTRQTHLVLVGSGEEEPKLRALATELRLPVYDHGESGPVRPWSSAVGAAKPGVHFHGFRQIDETPIFYALADAFVLSSLREEWGLVVNEAMACGLPVIVSETAGCAEDLLEPGWPAKARDHRAGLHDGLASAPGCRVCQNGFLFNPRSSEALAAALLALDSATELRNDMGRASRRIVEKFSCANFAEQAVLAARAALGDLRAVPTNGMPDNRAVASVPRAN